MTPHQRLAADVRTPDEVRARLQEIYAGLDPVVLLRDIRASQERLAALADVQPVGHTAAAEQPIELFLTSLRTAWKDGAIRPTDRPIVKAKRGRRRPDPLVHATPDLRKWFEAEPWRTGSELLSRLQTEYPGACPNKLLRTLQRRLKAWRSEQANALLCQSASKIDPPCDARGRQRSPQRSLEGAGAVREAPALVAGFEEVAMMGSIGTQPGPPIGVGIPFRRA